MIPKNNGRIPPRADPWRRLAASVAIQAVKDLRTGDIESFTDALYWFVGGQAEIYLTALDIFPDGDLLDLAVNNGY
jgi:hypothetical protein